jgi:putative peptide zinc metalloprotease protein
MQTQDIKYRLCSIEKEGRYIVISKNNYYSVDKISFQILDCLNQKLSFDAIAKILNTTNGIQHYNEKKINKVCEEKTMKEIISNEDKIEDAKKTSVNKAIYCRVNILKSTKAANLFSSLTFLFSEKIYTPLLILSSTTSLLYILYSCFFNTKAGINSTFLRLESFLFLFLIFFLHEVGHATAAMKYGIKTKGIGFGFYIIFPVLYTDITEIWILDKKKRIQINMAGIYFQLLVNMILIAIYFIYSQNELVATLIASNMFSVFLSFNPFFKYDGYWVASDFLNISNLSKKSNECLRMLRKFIVKPANMLPLIKRQPLVLIIYSILSFSFWSYFFIKLFFELFLKILKVFSKTNMLEWTILSYANALGLLLTFILLCYILSQKIKSNYNEQSNLY